MALVPQDIRDRFPVFADLGDGVIQPALDEAEARTNRAAFGSAKADIAVMYLAAHIIVVNERLNSAGSVAATATAVPSGPVTSERLMDWSATYAEGPFTKSALASTSWGQHYLELRRGVFADRRAI